MKNPSNEIKEIFNHYQPLIEKIDKIIINFSTGKSNLIKNICDHLINSGGKRIRPILLLVCANLLNKKIDEKILSLAAAVEMIHSATLLHDDVVDNSNVRRGIDTANSLWGNKASILVGDYVFSVAFQLMVKSENLKALELLAKTSSIMADGEVMQLENSSNLDISINDYFKIIHGKTAILFSAATSVPALIDKENEQEFKILEDLGKNIGIIFQIIDDILDYKSNNLTLGKSIGDDFFEGKVTLPLIILYQNANQNDKKIIKDIHQKNLFNEKIDENLDIMLKLFEKYQVFDKSFNEADKYRIMALKNLENFSNCQQKIELQKIINYSFSRLN